MWDLAFTASRSRRPTSNLVSRVLFRLGPQSLTPTNNLDQTAQALLSVPLDPHLNDPRLSVDLARLYHGRGRGGFGGPRSRGSLEASHVDGATEWQTFRNGASSAAIPALTAGTSTTRSSSTRASKSPSSTTAGFRKTRIPKEKNSWNEREDDYSSVAFWYQTGTPTFTARAPIARERTLPSLERVTAYGRHYVDAKYHGVGNASKQRLYDFYMKPQMLYVPEKAENAWVEIPLQVEKKEPLRLVLNSTLAPDYGRYQVLLNGVKIGGPLDFYSATVANTEFQLLDFWPDPGKYTVRLECVGKNPKSDAFNLGLESVNLRDRRPRVIEYGRDKDKDWKKKPMVY